MAAARRRHATARRESDRWLTPRVVVALIVSATVLVLATLAAVVYLAGQGFDAAPVVSLVGILAGFAFQLVQLVLQLVARKGQAKVERAAGTIPGAVADALADVLAPPAPLEDDSAASPATAAYAPLPPVPGTYRPTARTTA